MKGTNMKSNFCAIYITKYNIKLSLLTDTNCDHVFQFTLVFIKQIPDIFPVQSSLNVIN